MNINRFYPLVIISLSLSCAFFDRPDINIEPNNWTGKRFVFADLEDSYRRTYDFNKIWSKIHKNRYRPYYRFLGKRFSIIGTHKKFKQDFLIIEDEKENRYKMAIDHKENELNILPSYFLFDDMERQARNLIGETLWLNNTLNPKSFYTLSDYEFKRFEPVVVLDAFPYQNNSTDHPVWLKVSSFLGDEGFVRYNGDEGRVGVQDHYYTSEPLPRSWGKIIINKLLNKKIELGMKDRQVRIAIGNPNEVNATSSRHGISEQWVYNGHMGNKTYYQFEYGKLTYVSE